MKRISRIFPLRCVFRCAALLLAATATAQTYDLSWNTSDGGGVMNSTGGNWDLAGTIGQFDAGSFAAPMGGGGFTLVGGFWPAAGNPCATAPVRGDANCDGAIDFFDIDAFILALLDPDAYAVNYPSCSYLCTNDINEDGQVDFFDIDPFVTCVVNGGCP